MTKNDIIPLRVIYINDNVFSNINSDYNINPSFRFKVYLFISNLVERGLRRKRLFWYYNFKSKILKAAFGDHYYKRVIEYCISKKYIKANDRYSRHRFPKSYRLLEEAFPSLTFESIEARKTKPPPDLSLQPALCEVSFNPIASTILEKQIKRFRNEFRIFYWRYAFQGIDKSQLWITRDARTGRIFTNVTSLPKKLRRHLLLRGAKTTEIDIANSQPYLAASLYPRSCPEKERYLELVASGQFYEKINSGLGMPFELPKKREKLKKKIFKEIFFGEVSRGYEAMKVFDGLFPKLAGLILKMKTNNKPALALHLQEMEAKAIVGNVLKKAIDSNIPLLTVHDSVIVRSSDVKIVEAWMLETLYGVVGATPSLKTAA